MERRRARTFPDCRVRSQGLAAVRTWRNCTLSERSKRRWLLLSVNRPGRWRGGREERRAWEGGQLYLAGEASCAWASWRQVGDGIHNPTCCLHKTPFATTHTHTPSGTDSALNFLPVILAAGQRQELPNTGAAQTMFHRHHHV